MTGSNVRDRITELIRVPAKELVDHPANWRQHPVSQRRALASLLDDIGYADALIARREEGRLILIDGHLRKSLDPEQVVPVLVLDVDAAEAEMLLATLDPLAALARPDPEALRALLERTSSASAAVRELLEHLRREIPVSRVPVNPDDLPEPADPVCQPGDLWQMGEHRLLCGDATDPEAVARLMGGEQAQVLWTDPPYGIDYEGRTSDALRIQGDRSEGLDDLLDRSFANAASVLAPGAAIYICHPELEALRFLQAFAAQGWRLHQGLVWVKDTMVIGHADYHYRHEPIIFGYALGEGRHGRGGSGWYGGDGQDSVLEVPRPKASREHPTMKPVELIRRCLANSSKAGDVVLDPFAGSGSTLIASQTLGRRGFALELDPHYCDVILRRFERTSGVQPSQG